MIKQFLEFMTILVLVLVMLFGPFLAVVAAGHFLEPYVAANWLVGLEILLRFISVMWALLVVAQFV